MKYFQNSKLNLIQSNKQNKIRIISKLFYKMKILKNKNNKKKVFKILLIIRKNKKIKNLKKMKQFLIKMNRL